MVTINRPSELLPFTSYDHIIVSFSGGKDSTALALAVLETGVDPSKVELWHQSVDGGPAAQRLMDWPCTHSYCEAVAKVMGLPLFFQYKEGGFEGELLRENSSTKGVFYQDGHRTKRAARQSAIVQIHGDARTGLGASMSKLTMTDCIQFAGFCIEHKVHSSDLAMLVQAANRRNQTAMRLHELECGGCDTERMNGADDRAIERVKELAGKMGFEVSYSAGTFPTLLKGTQQVSLPCLG